MRSNCVIWAYAMLGRRRAKGRVGDIYWRWSHWGPFPHFFYGETINGRIRLVSYKPTNPRHKLVPPPLFKGEVCWGDRPRG